MSTLDRGVGLWVGAHHAPERTVRAEERGTVRTLRAGAGRQGKSEEEAMGAETRAKEAEAAAQAEWRQCGLWPSARETGLHIA